MTEAVIARRLSKVAKELNVSTSTIIDFLTSKKIEIENNPNAKVSDEVYRILLANFQSDKLNKELDEKVKEEKKPEKLSAYAAHLEETNEILIKTNIIKREKLVKEETPLKEKEQVEEVKTADEIVEPEKKAEETTKSEKIEEKIPEIKVVGKIDLQEKPKKEKAKKKEETLNIIEEKQEEEILPEQIKEEIILVPIEDEIPKINQPIAETIEMEFSADINEEELEIEEEETEIILPEIEAGVDESEPKGLKIIGKIDISQFENEKPKKKLVASTSDLSAIQGKRRKKIIQKKEKEDFDQAIKKEKGVKQEKIKSQKKKEEIDEKEIKDQIAATLAKLTSKQQAGVARAKFKKLKKEKIKERDFAESSDETARNIEVIEFITVNELANMMDVPVTEVITVCMNLGLMVNINQRLDAETITFVADEFGYSVQFKTTAIDEKDFEEMDNPKRMVERPPVITIMGHVDHGKTTLIDFIRKSRITEKEAGGITQHIGAYQVLLPKHKKRITVLDTPGHEAFTSMRARGAKVTDIVIIVIAADDSIMPQTREAISHAQAAQVPIVFAINKIDKEGANPDRIREQLAEMNILVEEWGGKYQCQEISAKKGLNIEELLEKVLLEAEMLELKADPKKRGIGTVIEATLDKGKGIMTTVLVQKGTVKVGDPILAGAYYGKVKALLDEMGNKINAAGPSTPVVILGFDGAPTAGDVFYVTETEAEAKEVATQRKRLLREQGIRATKHVTLDEIGRRIALGSFKELNIIIKGDVDGSVEALSDSLQKLTNEEVQVNVIHRGVGQISESDVLLASASDAVIIGFQVRPSLNARKLAEAEQIDIRLYSIIYDAIEEFKLAIEGMLAPTEVEKITCNIEVREVFKISKVGTVAGCMVLDGKINRNSKIRVIREGVVVFSGELASLKRFKEDVKEVSSGFECGIAIERFNDLKIGDIIEGYTVEQVKRKL